MDESELEWMPNNAVKYEERKQTRTVNSSVIGGMDVSDRQTERERERERERTYLLTGAD